MIPISPTGNRRRPTGGSPGASAHPTPGRRALVELLQKGDPDPTARVIAERAGVALRFVFHHFSDIDDLYRTVAGLQLERHWSDLPTFSAKLPLSARIERTVRHRSILYEEISPVRRAAIRRRRAPLRPG